MLPRRRADLTTRMIDGEIVILNRDSSEVHHLNPTASRIWELCDGSTSPEEIAVRVAASFNASADQIMSDVIGAVADLQRLGLISQQGE